MKTVHDRNETTKRMSGLRVAGAVAIAALLIGTAACNQNPPAETPAEPAAASAELVVVENLEPVTTTYIVANPTNVYNNHFVYDTTVVGELERGATVEVVGKVPGYEWVQIAQGGTPLGYVPISMLSPSDLYIP